MEADKAVLEGLPITLKSTGTNQNKGSAASIINAEQIRNCLFYKDGSL